MTTPTKRIHTDAPRLVTLISDPLPFEDGGLRPGSKFCKENFRCMMKLGNFTPGTILKIRTCFVGADRGTWVVVDNEGKGQRLITEWAYEVRSKTLAKKWRVASVLSIRESLDVL